MSKSATINPDATSGEPTRLKLAAPIPAQAKDEMKLKSRPSAVFAGGMDDEDDSNKKRRELIPLNYSDDEDDQTKAEKKKRRVKDMVSAIPNDKAGLWKYESKWEKLSEVSYKSNVLRSTLLANDCCGYAIRLRFRISFGRSWPKNLLSISVPRRKKS